MKSVSSREFPLSFLQRSTELAFFPAAPVRVFRVARESDQLIIEPIPDTMRDRLTLEDCLFIADPNSLVGKWNNASKEAIYILVIILN